MKILLADDEGLSRERLRNLLAEVAPDAEVVGEAANGAEALRMAALVKPDVVLMDINMPGLDGIHCARKLSNLDQTPWIVFITAHEDFALQAFEVAACDYLLKPVRKERLANTLARLKKLTMDKGGHAETSNRPIEGKREFICAQHGSEIKLIPTGEILYFLADQKYTTVRTLDGEALIEEPLKSLEAELCGQFVRIHRNSLVAAAFIEELEKGTWGGGKLWLRGLDEPLEVSRRCFPNLRALCKRLGKAS